MDTTTEHITIGLTDFQAAEIEGLLDNIDNQNTLAFECDSEDDFHPVWGTLDCRTNVLTVLLPDDAIDDIEYRAQWMIDEGPDASMTYCAVVGFPAARSLRSIITKINTARSQTHGASTEPEPVVVIKNVTVCDEFKVDTGPGANSMAMRAAEAGVFTRTVAKKNGNGVHHEIVAPTVDAAKALAVYVGFMFELLTDNVREDCSDWDEKRAQMTRRDAFGRAYRWLREFDR